MVQKFEEEHHGTDIHFHSFPRNQPEELRDAWISFCRRKDDLNPNSLASHKICSQHFEKEAYKRDLVYELLGLPTRKILLPTAVPTIFGPEFFADQKSGSASANPQVVKGIRENKNSWTAFSKITYK